jgi:hypothetical protein
VPTIEEPSATVRSLRNRISGYLLAQSVLLIAFAVTADPVASVAYAVEAALCALQPTRRRDNRLWLLARRVAARGGGGRRLSASDVMAYLFGGEGGAARLVLSVIAGGPIGFAWPLTSHSPLGTEQKPAVAAAGAVEGALDDRWPLG